MCLRTKVLSGGIPDYALPLYSAHHQLLKSLGGGGGGGIPSKCSTEQFGECWKRTSDMLDPVHVFIHSLVGNTIS